MSIPKPIPHPPPSKKLAMSTPIDVDNTPPTQPFLPEEWIGCGKKYPDKDTPQFVLAARIPSSLSFLLPNKKLSVLDFLRVVLP